MQSPLRNPCEGTLDTKSPDPKRTCSLTGRRAPCQSLGCFGVSDFRLEGSSKEFGDHEVSIDVVVLTSLINKPRNKRLNFQDAIQLEEPNKFKDWVLEA